MNTGLWLANLGAWSAQAAALIAVGSAAAWMFRLSVARFRLAYWQALLALCLVLPAVEPWRQTAASSIEITMAPARPAPPEQTGHAIPWRKALLVLLLSGGAARLAWLGAGFDRLRAQRRNSRRCHPLPEHLQQLRAALAPQAEFLLSPSLASPVTFGFRRPVVAVPERFATLPASMQEAIACHELLHIRRRDWIVTVVEEGIRALLWFHPAVWHLISQVQLAREQTVDAEVVKFTRNRRQYLDALLAMAEDPPALDLAPATLFLRKRHLRRRVALILKEAKMSKRRLISFCAASSGLLLAAGWLTLHTFPLQAAPQEHEPEKVLHSVAPEYPAEAREKRIEGAVVLELQIDTEGRVADARVLSGPMELRNAALQAVLQWHYSPKAMSLPASTQVTVDFKLPKEGTPQTDASPWNPLREGEQATLKHISIEGLPPGARADLLQRLPVHEGDLVDTHQMAEALERVQAFDSHLKVAASRDEAGNLSARIYLPGTDEGRRPERSPIRVGGQAQQAKLLAKTMPTYPAEAKAAGIQGLVRLQAIIGKDGSVENLVVLEGDPMLAAAALDAVRKWQYEPTLLNGDPVAVTTVIDVNFTLAR